MQCIMIFKIETHKKNINNNNNMLRMLSRMRSVTHTFHISFQHSQIQQEHFFDVEI